MEIKSGIYKITNLINGKIYIGSAVNLYKRKNLHFSKLRANKHHSIHLQRAFNKYGEDNFLFEILEEIENKGNLISREQHYIDNLKPEFNICKFAGSTLGTKRSLKTKLLLSKKSARKNKAGTMLGKNHSEASKQLISINKKGQLKGIKQSREHIDKRLITKSLNKVGGKSVVQLNNNFELINSFNSLREANLKMCGKIRSSSIINVCKNKPLYNTAYGFKWMYKSEYELLINNKAA